MWLNQPLKRFRHYCEHPIGVCVSGLIVKNPREMSRLAVCVRSELNIGPHTNKDGEAGGQCERPAGQ